MSSDNISVMIMCANRLFRDSLSAMINSDERFSVVLSRASLQEPPEFENNRIPAIAIIEVSPSDSALSETIVLLSDLYPGIKILCLSQQSMPPLAKKMVKLGVSGYATKNISKEEFMRGIIEVNEGKIYISSDVKEAIIRQQVHSSAVVNDINQLSRRQLEIALFIKDGLSSKDISKRLGLSTKTVEIHRCNILRKLNVHNTAALVNLVNQMGFYK